MAVKEFKADAELSRLPGAKAEAKIHDRAQMEGNHVVDSSDYTAPEMIRARNQSTLVTERAAIWSLGVMLFKITKRVMPFPANEWVSESFSLILDFAEKGWVARFKQLGLDPTDRLHQLIGEMLDPDPLKRPSAQAVLAHPSIASHAG
ncbi:protein kinase domain-containing protein [Variovorax sp. RA8]|uniref:protein kinase domain-containing protein n=1 Tax=Variovorax sp. (strain JCM 16519 / RA8) TaxID=662548 RepID=UPI000AFB7725|nr:hypothetical protein [Variovorax sp. RA8]VTU32793.1 Protein kinase domain protein [Variovorax sp. RA8]